MYGHNSVDNIILYLFGNIKTEEHFKENITKVNYQEICEYDIVARVRHYTNTACLYVRK